MFCSFNTCWSLMNEEKRIEWIRFAFPYSLLGWNIRLNIFRKNFWGVLIDDFPYFYNHLEFHRICWTINRRSKMSRFHVGGKVVDTVDLLRKRHWAWRLDMWPFTILYGVWLSTVVPSLDFGDASIVLGSILAFHVLVFLFTVWSVDFKCFIQYSKVRLLYPNMIFSCLSSHACFAFNLFTIILKPSWLLIYEGGSGWENISYNRWIS